MIFVFNKYQGNQESMRSKSATAGSSSLGKTSCKQQAGSAYFNDDDDEDDFYDDFTRKNTNLSKRFNNKVAILVFKIIRI